MITALFLGILIGFALSIPPGPLALAFMKKAVVQQYRAAILVAAGAALMDVFYNLLAAFASSALVVWLSDFFIENKWVSVLFQLICIVVLLILGIRHLRDKHDPTTERHMVERERMQEQRAERMGHGSPFFLGILIAFTNLATPTFLPSMVAAISYMHAEGILAREFSASLLYSIGFGIGTTLWFLVIQRLIMRYRDKFSSAFITSVYKIAGGTFILFSVILVYNVITSKYWTTMF